MRGTWTRGETVFRGLATRVNFLSLDCPDLQFSGKAASREMAKPTLGSWKFLTKLARYLLGMEAVVWVFGWQDEVELAHTFSDCDFFLGGRNIKDRKSTAGGVWMLGGHLIKTWSASSQGGICFK